MCKECGGGSICEQNTQSCGGSICEHKRDRHRCKECRGSSVQSKDRKRKTVQGQTEESTADRSQRPDAVKRRKAPIGDDYNDDGEEEEEGEEEEQDAEQGKGESQATDYEARRLENMRRNAELLQSLGISSDLSALSRAGVVQELSPRVQKRKVPRDDTEPVRRSERVISTISRTYFMRDAKRRLAEEAAEEAERVRREEAKTVGAGHRVAVLFGDNRWYDGTVTRVVVYRRGQQRWATVTFDDGGTSTVRFPDPAFRLLEPGPDPPPGSEGSEAEVCNGQRVAVLYGNGQWYDGKVVRVTLHESGKWATVSFDEGGRSTVRFPDPAFKVLQSAAAAASRRPGPGREHRGKRRRVAEHDEQQAQEIGRAHV